MKVNRTMGELHEEIVGLHYLHGALGKMIHDFEGAPWGLDPTTKRMMKEAKIKIAAIRQRIDENCGKIYVEMFGKEWATI